MSRIGGFDCVPVTVFVDGPLGPGSLQAWVDVDEDETNRLVDLVPTEDVPAQGWFSCVDGLDARDRPVVGDPRRRAPDLRLLAVFDVLINNADRKGGHILGSGAGSSASNHGSSLQPTQAATLLWGWAGAGAHRRELAAVRGARDGGARSARR